MRIQAADALVIESGNAMDKLLGTIKTPSGVDYDMIPHRRNDGMNSNTAAYTVANRASNKANNGNQKLPLGSRNPGWGEGDRLGSTRAALQQIRDPADAVICARGRRCE